MTDRLITKLLGDDAGPPTWQELADAVWLAGHFPPPADGPPDDGTPVMPDGWPPPRPRPTAPLLEAPEPPVPLVAPSHSVPDEVPSSGLGTLALPGGQREGTVPVRLRTPPALPHALALRRALRPLGRRSRPGIRTPLEMDEEATVDRVAGTGFWYPVLRPAPVRWLDVALVVDDSVSMSVWDSAVREFRTLLQTTGTFRSVQDWTLLSEESRSRGVVLRRGMPASTTATDRSPGELVDPNGRRIVLVVSDCISPSWSDGTLARLLRLWGTSGPVAIVQPLPRRMWERSRLGLHDVKLHSPTPGSANSRLVAQSRRGSAAPITAMPVPLLMLDPRSLGPWASLTSGESSEYDALAILVDGAAQSPVPRGEPVRPPSSPTELLADFRALASPEAFKLAVYLAAVPLSQPIMRVVQQVMLSDPQPSQIAEILLSRLLTRAEDSVGTRGDDIVFDFCPGVREELLSGLSQHAARRILQLVSEYVSDRIGSHVDFTALLRGEDTAVALLQDHRVFAEVSAQVLRRLGGMYETVAQRLEAVPAASMAPDASGLEPPAWGTPPPRAVELFGREPLLKELHDALMSGDAAPHVLVAAEGGGATAPAVEYVHAHGADFAYVLWLSAGSPMIGGADLARLTAEVARRTDEGAEPSWLLVLDGATPAEGLPKLPGGSGRVLVTSSVPDWPEGFTVHRVPAPSPATGIRITRRHAPALVPSEARRLAERLDGTPLALEIAGTFLSVTGQSADAYLDRLGPRSSESPRATPDPSTEACGISLDHVLRETPQARDVLHRLAVLAPGPVPVALLANGIPRQAAGGEADPVLAALCRYALLRNADPAGGQVFVHPAAQRACRERMTEDELAIACRAVRARMVEHFGSDAPEVPALWPRFAALTPHLGPVGVLGDKDPDARALVVRHLRYLRACGDLDGCQALGTLALRQLAARAGAGHPGVTALAALLAGVLEAGGATDDADRLRANTEGWLRDLAHQEPDGT
ncbi:SAV_2336 N-terminal domain-related protein [Streptomyces mirabilis]|uniref:SAV_2336 N-terminal domain-related protein n=1 Tax=Streptomyces mirabilis TaxID=68239 RepID=UPI0036A4699E